MRRYNLLSEYPKANAARFVGSNIRTIKHRIVASLKGKDFYDGDRNYGYGGFKYDGRWKKIAKKIYEEYNLNDKSSFLQLSCEKGFLLKDLKDLNSNIKITGLETSDYAISACETGIKENIKKCDNYIPDSQSQTAILGELHHAIKNNIVSSKEKFIELGDIILDPSLGRKNNDDITICDLTGTGVQDTAIARYTFDLAMSKNLGTKV